MEFFKILNTRVQSSNPGCKTKPSPSAPEGQLAGLYDVNPTRQRDRAEWLACSMGTRDPQTVKPSKQIQNPAPSEPFSTGSVRFR